MTLTRLDNFEPHVYKIRDISLSSFEHPVLHDMLERMEDKLGFTWDDDSLEIAWNTFGVGSKPGIRSDENIYGEFTQFQVKGLGPDNQKVLFRMSYGWRSPGYLPAYILKIDGEEPNRAALDRLVFSDLYFATRHQTAKEYHDKSEAWQKEFAATEYKPKKLDWD